MILRRIASAIRRQDWFTVAVETMIVVLGVFLGLQVNNWNETRQVKAEERATFVRLISEAEQYRGVMDEYRLIHLRKVEETVRLVARLESPADCADFESAESRKALLGVGDFPGLRSSLTTAKELVASGRLAIVQSDEMRDAIRDIVDQTLYVNEAWRRYIPVKQAAEQVYIAAGFAMTDSMELKLDYEDPYREILSAFKFRTPEHLCDRPDLVALASNAANSQTFYLATLNQTRTKLETYIEILQAYSVNRWGAL